MSSMIDKFDFSGLSTYPPAGLRIRHAGEYLHAERQTANYNKHFVIVKRSSEFWLFSFTSQNTNEVGALANCNERNFVMRTDSLARLLSLLGYGKRGGTQQR